MNRLNLPIFFFLIFTISVLGQSVSFNSYMNPVIPGDHPDCTITKIGNDFYTTGSSFNVTPVIHQAEDAGAAKWFIIMVNTGISSKMVVRCVL